MAGDVSGQELGRGFLESLRSRYEEQGYKFLISPQSSDLPSFLADYVPDAIALKAGNNIAIEVKGQKTQATDESIRRIRHLFYDQPDWHLTVAFVGGKPAQVERLPVEPQSAVLLGLTEAEKLMSDGHLRAAFVTGWSLLEASLNSLHPRADKRPRTPGSVVQNLAANGNISTESERTLRSLIQMRNRIVHGDLSVEPSAKDVSTVLDAVSSTLRAA